MVEPAMSVGPAALNNPENPSLSAAPKDRRQYTCLCGIMHLRTATLLIGALETVAVSVAVVSLIVRYSQGIEPVGSLVIVLISAIVGTAALLCLFLAVRRQSPALLLPHMAAQVLAVIALLIFAIVLSAALISIALYGSSADYSLPTGIGVLVLVLLATGVGTWFTVVVAKYYHFLRGHL